MSIDLIDVRRRRLVAVACIRRRRLPATPPPPCCGAACLLRLRLPIMEPFIYRVSPSFSSPSLFIAGVVVVLRRRHRRRRPPPSSSIAYPCGAYTFLFI
jgi:hypothetical protein